jgi:hypothetical protein
MSAYEKERKMTSKLKSSRNAVAIAFVLALAGTAPAWSRSQIGNGLSAAQDPYSRYFSGPAPAYRGFSGYVAAHDREAFPTGRHQ